MAGALAINDEKNYITPEGFAALQAEFHQLYKIERPDVVHTVYEEHIGIPSSCFGESSYFVKEVHLLDK